MADWDSEGEVAGAARPRMEAGAAFGDRSSAQDVLFPRESATWEREQESQEREAKIVDQQLAIINVANKAQLKTEVIRAKATQDRKAHSEKLEMIQARKAAEAFQENLEKNKAVLMKAAAIEAQKAAECSQNLMAEAPQKTAVAPPLLKKSQVGQGDAGSDDQHEGKAKVCSRRTRLLFWAAVLLSLLVVGGVVLVVKFPEVLGRDGAIGTSGVVVNSVLAEQDSLPFVQVLVRFQGLTDDVMYFTCITPKEAKKKCDQRKADVRRAISQAIGTAPTAPAIDPPVQAGDVLLREVARYGDALTAQDQAALRRNADMIRGSAVRARVTNITQVQTRHYVLGPRRGQYHDLSLDDPSVPDETRLPPSEWQLRSAANAQQPRKPGQGRRAGVAKTSISAVFRVVCRDIEQALLVESALGKALAVGGSNENLVDAAMRDLGYGDVRTSLLGQAMVVVPAVCGDGSRHEVEACDDKNLKNGDGCSSSCQVEKGWACVGGHSLGPDTCAPQCGNAVATSEEECDDGNLAGRDGCDSRCRVEPGWLCTVDQTSCASDVPCLGRSECQQLLSKPAVQPQFGKHHVRSPLYARGSELSAQELMAIQLLYLNVSLSLVLHQPDSTSEAADGVETATVSTPTIRFTLNGSDPLVSGEVYTGSPFQLGGGTTHVRVIATAVVQWPNRNTNKSSSHLASPEARGEFSVSICQDGIRTLEEECDDGEGGKEGCSTECTVENGWICPAEMQTTASGSMGSNQGSHASVNAGSEMRDHCKDCKAEMKAAELAAEAAGLDFVKIELNCPSGKYDECNTCQDCPVGFYCEGGPDNLRFPCPSGTYVDYRNAFECEACPAFSISERRSDSVDDCRCLPGYTGVAASPEGCQECKDSYKSLPGPHPCTPCPSLTRTLIDGPTHKVDCKCKPGYHNKYITADYAQSVANNLLLPESQKVIWQVPPVTDVICEECQVGHYCLGDDHPQRECAADSYASSGSAECYACPANSQNPGMGPIASQGDCACSRGFYSKNEDGSPPCAPCHAGTYKKEIASSGREACLTCPPGTYSDAINASDSDTCTPCSLLPGAAKRGGGGLTSPRGSTGSQHCLSGVWLAVANMGASQGRPTRVFRWNFDGASGLDVRQRVAPYLPQYFDSDAIGRLAGVVKHAWLEQSAWDLMWNVNQVSRNPEAILFSSTYDTLRVLQANWDQDEVYLEEKQTRRQKGIGQAQALVTYRFYPSDPVLLITLQADMAQGFIYYFQAPDETQDPPLEPRVFPLKGEGASFKACSPSHDCTPIFGAGLSQAVDMHAFRPYPDVSGSIWYLAVAIQRAQRVGEVTSEAFSPIFKWVPGQPGACVAPYFDCGKLQLIQLLPSKGASDFESFHADGRTYVVLASATDELGSKQPIRVYSLNISAPESVVPSGEGFLQLHQEIGAMEARTVTPFEIDHVTYLAVAQWRGPGVLPHQVASPIYRWDANASNFSLHQTLPTLGAKRWRHLSVRHAENGVPIHERHYLAVANHYSNSIDIDSSLFLWDPATRSFQDKPFQTFETSAAADLAFLTLPF